MCVYMYILCPDKSTADKLMLQMKCNCWHRTREELRTHLSRITIIFAPLAGPWPHPPLSVYSSLGVASICSNSKNKWRQSTFAYFSGRLPFPIFHSLASYFFFYVLYCFVFHFGGGFGGSIPFNCWYNYVDTVIFPTIHVPYPRALCTFDFALSFLKP